jgi:hypothetical protein
MSRVASRRVYPLLGGRILVCLAYSLDLLARGGLYIHGIHKIYYRVISRPTGYEVTHHNSQPGYGGIRPRTDFRGRCRMHVPISQLQFVLVWKLLGN